MFRIVLQSLVIAFCGTLVSACGSREVEKPRDPKPSLPQVLDTQTGRASWYGKKFHGKKTASGRIYDMDQLTAAHRSWKFGTQVRVTRLDTGAVVEVTITDRGPYHKKRVIDLSRKAASELDMLEAGVVEVKLEVLKWGGGRYYRERK